jgi:dihydroflavonol-4-reductase
VTGPAFVTGGSGFVGGALLERLVADGREVRALARSDWAAARVSGRGATPVAGDVLDLERLAAVMDGCETVFHAAGVNAMCLRDPRPMLRANIEGSGNVIVAARRAGVRRVVYTSSASTLGEPRGTIGREDSPHRGRFLSSYERSKHLAERRVLAWSEGLGVDIVCVNPSSVQGPGRTGGSARLLLDLANGRLPVVVDAAISIVDVADCAQAHLLAEERGARGERYVASGATLTMREAVALLRRIAGVPERARFVPPLVVRAGGSAVEVFSRLARRDPPVCREAVRTLLHGHRYDGSRAERELGLRYTPLEETLVRTLTWYAERGLAPPPRDRGSRPSEGAP